MAEEKGSLNQTQKTPFLEVEVSQQLKRTTRLAMEFFFANYIDLYSNLMTLRIAA